MILRQFLHTDPVGISYLFGCGGKAAGAVVDPVGDIEPYLRAAEDAGMRIHFVIDTHVHADHLSAGRALAEAAGADYVLSAQARRLLPVQGRARRRRAAAWQRRREGAAHARPHAGAHLPSRQRPHAGRRAVVRA